MNIQHSKTQEDCELFKRNEILKATSTLPQRLHNETTQFIIAVWALLLIVAMKDDGCNELVGADTARQVLLTHATQDS